MPTIFENLSDGFYTAFFEPDPEKRKAALGAWIQEATPVIQKEVENDLRTWLEFILKDTWSPEGWKTRAEKYFSRKVRIGKKDEAPFIDAYKLYLDIKLRTHNPGDIDLTVGALSPETRARTLETAEKALPKPQPVQKRNTDSSADSNKNASDYGDDDIDDGGRSPNDDRSDSMNPNNDAYWSSRGH